MVDEFHDRNLLSKFFIYFRKLSELRYQRLLQFYIHMGKRRIHRILIAWYDLRKGHIHRKLAKQLIEAQNMGLLQQVLARWKCQILRGIAWQKEIFEKVQIVRLRHIIYNWRKAIIYRDMRNEQAIAAFQVYQSLKLAFHAFQKAAKKRLIIRHRRQVLVRVLQSWKEVSTGLRLYRTAKSQERGGLEARVRFLNSRIRLNTLSRMLQNWRLRWEQRLEIKLSHSHYKYKVANNTFQAIKQYNLSQRLTSAFMSAAASTLLANRIKSMMVTLEVSHFRKSKLQSKAWIGFQMNSDGVRLDTVLHHMRSRRLCKTALSSWVLFSLHSVLARTGEDNYEHKLTLKAWVGWRILSDIRQFLNERNFPAAMTAARTFGHNSNKSVSKIAKIHFQHRLLKRALAALIEQHHFLGTLPLTLQNLPISPIGDLKAAEALADQRRQVKDLTIVLEDDDEDACNEQNTNAEELQLPANATLKCRMLVNLIRKRHTLSGLFAKWKAGKPARRYDFPRSPANATAASHTNSPHGKVDFPRSPANATESSRPNSPHGKNDFPRSPAKATATSQPKCPVPKSAPPKPTPAPAQPKPSATNPIQAKRAPNRIKVAKKPPVKNKENITDKLLKASSEARKERRDKAQSAYEQALQKHKPSMQSARAQMSSAKQMQKSVRDRKNKKISKIISTMATSPPKVPLTEKSSSSGMSTLGETLLKFQHDLTTPK